MLAGHHTTSGIFLIDGLFPLQCQPLSEMALVLLCVARSTHVSIPTSFISASADTADCAVSEH